MKLFKKLSVCLLIVAIFLPSAVIQAFAEPSENEMKFDCTSAILIEAKSGDVLFEQNADQPLPPASVTKVMTLLLVMESIENKQISLDDMVTASAHACSMGGSPDEY